MPEPMHWRLASGNYRKSVQQTEGQNSRRIQGGVKERRLLSKPGVQTLFECDSAATSQAADCHLRQLQFEIAPTDCPPRTRAAASASPAGRSHSKNVGQRDREADPARGGSYSQGKFFDLATTPALCATPPVPGGEPEFQTETLPSASILIFAIPLRTVHPARICCSSPSTSICCHTSAIFPASIRYVAMVS